MVLLITTGPHTAECVQAIQRTTGEVVRVAANGRDVRAALREQFSVVVVEELLWDGDRRLAETLQSGIGTAALLVLNLAITSVSRLVAQVAAALNRRAADVQRTREQLERHLCAELKEAVTGILLSSELALGTPGLPEPARTKIRAVYEVAVSMRQRLGMAA